LNRTLFTLAVLVTATLMPIYAHAWGREGHRLTALVAQDHLTPTAAENVKWLLGKESMADVAPWADEYKQDHRESASWHFVSVPGVADSYDRMRDCPAPNNNPTTRVRDCVIDRILYFEDVLKYPAVEQTQKTFALKMLIHLMGDLQQPFHNISEGRGGNEVPVIEFGATSCEGRPCNLHSTWDDGLINHRNLNENKYVALLEQEATANDWQKKAAIGTVEDWSNAGHHYAQNAWVAPGTIIGKDYFNKWIPVVDQQLALGGLRLADALNEIFTTSPSTK